MACVALCANALEFTVGKLKYSTSGMAEGKVKCTGFASGQSSGSILIPGKVTYSGTTYQVYAVGENAFFQNTTSTVLKIGWGVEVIEQSAFSQSSLKYVYLPSSITDINKRALYCTNLDRVCVAVSDAFPNLATGDSDNNTFNTYYKPEIVINPTIARNLNTSNQQKWVNVDKDARLEVNGALANDFEDDYQYYVITSAVGASTNTAMLVGARNGKTAIDLKNNALCGTNTEYGGSGNFYCRFTAIAEHAFEGNTTITSVGADTDYTPWLEEIGTMAFSSCTSITSIVTNAKKIGNGAFRYCTALKSLSLYNSTGESFGVQELSTGAFSVAGLTQVYIPKSMKKIDYSAFSGCASLKSFEANSNNERYYTADGVLYDTQEETLQQVPAVAVISTITWPLWVTKIGRLAFEGNKNIQTLNIPYGVTSIGEYAFNNSNIKSLKVPSSVTYFEPFTFRGMRAISKLFFNKESIPDALTIYGTAFEGIATGAQLYVPRGSSDSFVANSTWNNAFSVISDGGAFDIETTGSRYYTVTSTEQYTDTVVQAAPADGQAKLVYPPLLHNYYEQLLVENTVSARGKTYIVTSIDSHAFDGYTKLKMINGGLGLKTIPTRAFADCSNLETVRFRYLETIGEQAFYNLKNLKTFLWGENLKTIADNAFNGCGFDKEIVLPASVTSIGSRAFYNCASLPGLFLSNPKGGTITWQFYGNNAAGFTCYVPLSAFYRFSNFATWTVGNGTAADQMHPYLKPETEWSVFSCHKPYVLDDDAEYYGIINYDDGKAMVTTQKSALPGYSYTALLMRATPGSVHRLKITDSGSILATMLKGAYEPNVKVETEADGYTNFVFNPATARFERISGYKYFQPGQAYLRVPTTAAAEIQIDMLYQAPAFDKGDVNEDGNINAGDVSALYSVILGTDLTFARNADLNDDGNVNAGDVSTLYELILAK